MDERTIEERTPKEGTDGDQLFYLTTRTRRKRGNNKDDVVRAEEREWGGRARATNDSFHDKVDRKSTPTYTCTSTNQRLHGKGIITHT